MHICVYKYTNTHILYVYTCIYEHVNLYNVTYQMSNPAYSFMYLKCLFVLGGMKSDRISDHENVTANISWI